MLRQQFGRPFRRMSQSYNLSYNIVPNRGSLKQSKKTDIQLKIGYNSREGESNQKNYYMESTFKTFGYCEQDSQQMCLKTLAQSIERKHSLNINHQSKENIIRFSDLKKNRKQKQNEPNYGLQKHGKNTDYFCQNHPKRLARFYINSFQKNNRQISHFYCVECSANLSQMNFDIRSINGANSVQDRYQNTLKKLVDFKNKLNQKQQKINQQSNIWLIQNLIKQTDEKYERMMVLLQNVKKQQIMGLQMLKIQVFNEVSQYQSKIQVLKRRLQYLIAQFGKYVRSENYRGFAIQKKWQKIYEQSMNKMKQQFEVCCKQPPIQPPVIPQQLTLTQICKKLQNLFNHRVHELSFDLDEQQQEQESEIKKQNFQKGEKLDSCNQKRLNLHFKQDKQQQSFLNRQNMVSGVDLVFSQTNSFHDQQNIMINI